MLAQPQILQNTQMPMSIGPRNAIMINFDHRKMCVSAQFRQPNTFFEFFAKKMVAHGPGAATEGHWAGAGGVPWPCHSPPVALTSRAVFWVAEKLLGAVPGMIWGHPETNLDHHPQPAWPPPSRTRMSP